ncbi:MAG: 4Fe-4S dicluster domain-containing protein [Candidatus Ranarchaeia archaeon]
MVYEKEEFFEKNVTSEDIQKYITWQEKRDKMYKQKFNFHYMPEIMDMSFDSEVWSYFADKCISCGQCTMVCPTCNCYNVTDYYNVTNKTEGRRERIWDSCMFVDYSLVAGGHNFRGKRADRLKLWYTHKLKAFGGRLGKPACVGCGRCVETCPVDINVLTVSNALCEQKVPQK